MNIYDNLPRGAIRNVAKKLKVTETAVSRVRNGKAQSFRIRKALLQELEKVAKLKERETELEELFKS